MTGSPAPPYRRARTSSARAGRDARWDFEPYRARNETRTFSLRVATYCTTGGIMSKRSWATGVLLGVGLILLVPATANAAPHSRRRLGPAAVARRTVPPYPQPRG